MSCLSQYVTFPFNTKRLFVEQCLAHVLIPIQYPGFLNFQTLDEVWRSVESDNCGAGPSSVTYPQPAKRKHREEDSSYTRNSTCTETNEMSFVDQQSNTLEQMESELPEEENEIVASKE